jgi:hypothetical protein
VAPVTGPQSRTPVADGPAAPGRGTAGGRRAARGGKAGAPRPRKARRRRYPLSAIFGALLLVLFAGGALYLGARLTSSPPKSAAGHQAKPRTQAAPTPTPTPTLGPYGHIGSRQQDPAPLTIAQLYPVSFTAAGTSFDRTSSRLSGDCIDAVVGANLQSAVSSAGCSQAARATYLAAQRGVMGTIGVLNLRSAKAATRAANAAGASNFIARLPGKSGPTHKLGQGTGIEEAAAKGHYLILIWAELTDRRRPKASQRPGLEQFMTELLQNTANVSLTNRMVDGTPA